MKRRAEASVGGWRSSSEEDVSAHRDGAIWKECRLHTIALGEFLAVQPHSRVILETCAEAFAIADAGLAAGHEVRVVPATLVRQLGVGSRGVKTDVRDARLLSEVSL